MCVGREMALSVGHVRAMFLKGTTILQKNSFFSACWEKINYHIKVSGGTPNLFSCGGWFIVSLPPLHYTILLDLGWGDKVQFSISILC